MTASETPCEKDTGLSLKELMLLPVILLWLTFRAFAQHVVTLKEMRRTKPLPIGWQEHWPNLRLAEWHIRSLTSFGIEVLLAGQELNLHDLPIVLAPPEDFGAMPRSALEMHRQFEAIARFHADPERHIRRAAERITAHDGEPDPLGRANSRPEAAVVVIVIVILKKTSAPSRLSIPHVALRHASHPAQPLRAPPWLNQKFQHLNSWAYCPEERTAAPCFQPTSRLRSLDVQSSSS